ncbi:DNA replication terminus site binding protein [Chromohalobacter marismortui]|uniref:DNA replication terminus site binding protein n=1 Tax=Chromohalobacter marismortui TaxID=42055 RepID=A0A4R7NW79_9GAMM|nr:MULTISPECIES: DNA replication terminus site-binding protein [Chromohalobacter]MCI0510395.1 DNA replication terminus site-binding protein [Chromohalobacter sp.]MCI0594720.1 DNA replication terminus site-binding protein [Chromohalobacter sp.]TDU25029.1 DNA replication terminus site binding protein [Chromohalobacter marismortui]
MERQYHLLARLEHDFDHVIETCEALIGHVEHAPPTGWVLGETTFDIAWLRHALFDFWYQDGQDGRATRNYIGLIAASPALLGYVADINRAKQTFAATLAEIRQEAPTLLPEIKAVLPFRHPTLHDHLRGQGLARLHLKQCWRHLPVADAPLSRVRLAWYTSGRSIKRLSVRDAERRLMEMDTESPHIRIQLRHLAGIPDSEPLAQVQTQAPVMRANLFFRDALADGRMRRAMNLPLPLFIPAEDGHLPSHNTPKTTPPSERSRAQRADTKLEDTPFLPSLRVYRYR